MERRTWVMEDLPLDIHQALILFGVRCDRAASQAGGAVAEGCFASKVEDYASRIAGLVAFILGEKLEAPQSFTITNLNGLWLAAYGDHLSERVGAANAAQRISKLGSALRAVFEQDFACIDDELARLRKFVAEPRPPRVYGLPRSELPEGLEFLAFRIATNVEISTKGDVLLDTASRSNWERILLRYLAILKAKGIAIEELTEATLVTPDYLVFYLNRACIRGNPAQALYELRSALLGTCAEAFATALSRLGVFPARRNLDYDTYVPDDERTHLEAALSRAATDRLAYEPGALEKAIANKMRRTYGNWHRCLAAKGVTAVDIEKLDMRAALDAFEDAHKDTSTRSLIGRLSEVRAAVIRIRFEGQRDALATGPGHALPPCPAVDALKYRIRQLKFSSDPKVIMLPDGVTPRDIERLGRILIKEAWQRLKGLLATKTPYRSIRPLAEKYRDGLLFVLFSAVCLRCGDMSSLLLPAIGTDDRSATIYESGSIWAVDLVSKNREVIYQPLAPWIGALITFYIDVVRELIAPIIENENDRVFWMSRTGGALTIGTFYENVTRHIRRRLDVKMTPHMLRTLEASWALMDVDKDPEFGSKSLGHRSKRTTRTYYQAQKAVQIATSRAEGTTAFADALVTIDPVTVRIEAAKRSARLRTSTGG